MVEWLSLDQNIIDLWLYLDVMRKINYKKQLSWCFPIFFLKVVNEFPSDKSVCGKGNYVIKYGFFKLLWSLQYKKI